MKMNEKQFRELVAKVREAQKNFFKYSKTNLPERKHWLDKSIALERQLDEELKNQ